MKKINQAHLTGERALFQGRDLEIYDSVFADGESPLKESANIRLYETIFKWKYPLWYGEDIRLENCTLLNTARAGVWYTKGISMKNCTIEAPKTFRRCDGIDLEDVVLSDAQETLWSCKNVRLTRVAAKGDYFAMNARDMEISDFTLTGNYGFDGAKNVVIRGAKMLTKDAFWNSENVTVYDSLLSGEYLGWNAKNLTLINCTVESLQGLCYVENLVMKNCKLIDTTLAFEYSSVHAEIVGRVDSVKNPSSGYICADEFGEIIVEKDKADPAATRIVRRESAGEALGALGKVSPARSEKAG